MLAMDALRFPVTTEEYVEAVKKIEPSASKSRDKRKTGRNFDKVAYQREYMRKRRAKEKSDGGS